MSMTATVSRLSSFRYWRGNEEATTEDWLNELNAPPNHRMDVGAAFQTVLENLSVGGEFANCTADGISFNFKCDAAIPQLNPVYGRKDYGQVLVSGKAGIVDGKRVEVFKTTKRFEAEKRQDDYQWRLLLDLFDADEFVWNIFVIAPNNPDETSYDVVDYHRLTATRYPGLHDDCVSLVNDYHGIMSSIPEEDMFMASIGRGKAKANALPKETAWITIIADILQQTEPTAEHDGAILVNCGEVEKLWIPLSVCKFSGEVGDTGVEVDVQEWWANQEGLYDGQGKAKARPKPEQEGAAEAATTPTDAPADEQGGAQDSMPAEPAPACRFKGDVTSLEDGSIVLTVTSPKGKEKAFTFAKFALRFEGDDVADLQVGYKGIDFVIGWDVAVESGLAKHLKLKAPTPAPDTAPQEQTETAPAVPEAAPDAAEDEAPQKEAKPYKSKLRSEKITDYVKLSDTELANYGKEMSEAMTKRTEHKETAAHYSRLSRDAEKEAYKLNDIIQAGHEEREIHCDVIGDFNTGEIVYVESEYPHREIRRQPMTEKDRQLLLPITPPAQPQPEPEAAAAQSAEPETTEAEQEPETVTLYGSFQGETENGIKFMVFYGDDAGTEAEFDIPSEQVILMQANVPEEEQDTLTLSLAYAVEAGIVAAPEEDAAPDRTCETCIHYDCTNLSCEGPWDDECSTDKLNPAYMARWEPLAEPEKACASCSHLDAAADDNACEGCGDDLLNYTPLSATMAEALGANIGGAQ